jgi:hypothetical protein
MPVRVRAEAEGCQNSDFRFERRLVALYGVTRAREYQKRPGGVARTAGCRVVESER